MNASVATHWGVTPVLCFLFFVFWKLPSACCGPVGAIFVWVVCLGRHTLDTFVFSASVCGDAVSTITGQYSLIRQCLLLFCFGPRRKILRRSLCVNNQALNDFDRVRPNAAAGFGSAERGEPCGGAAQGPQRGRDHLARRSQGERARGRERMRNAAREREKWREGRGLPARRFTTRAYIVPRASLLC